jgi:choline transport protein
VYFSLSTLAVTITAILAGSYPNYPSNTWVFTDAENMNKSYSKGILFILCLLNSTYGFMGSDAGAYMAEEIPSPSINVPKIIVSLIFIPHITVVLRLIAEAGIPYYHRTSDR